TYCPVNFITWNYDLNLLLSLKNYFYPDTTIGKFRELIKFENSESIWKIGDDITVINMNGYFFSNEIAENLDLNSEIVDMKSMFERKLNGGDFLSSEMDDKDSALIRFAWETHSMEESIIPDCIGL